jgi:hypothetical protein
MWHFANDKRPPRPDSPLDAKYWIVTADYRFLGYDAFKHRDMTNEIPICLHPTAVIQLLQFWVPMDSEFETALFSAIRLPTVLAPFDGDAERISLQILNALSTFANISDMPAETTTRILLNDALRQKLALEKEVTKQIDLVREALIEENRKADERVRTEVAKSRQMELQSKELESQLTNTLQDTASLKSDLAEARERERVAKDAERAALVREQAVAEDLQRINDKLVQREKESQRLRRRNHRAIFTALYFGTLIAVIGAALHSHSWFIQHVVVASLLETVALLLWAIIFGWCGTRIDAIKSWAPFKWLMQAKLWLLLAVIAGIAGNAAWALLGRATTAENKSVEATRSQSASGQPRSGEHR